MAFNSFERVSPGRTPRNQLVAFRKDYIWGNSEALLVQLDKGRKQSV